MQEDIWMIAPKSLIKVNQLGETIVEVLIALVVIGSSLAGAYAISNNASKSTQANHERYQAQVLANNQVEFLDKSIKSGDVTRDNYGGASLSEPAITSALRCFDDNGLPKTGDECSEQSYGGLYSINIQCLNGGETLCNDTGDGYRVFRVHVEWNSLNGGKDNVEVFYGI